MSQYIVNAVYVCHVEMKKTTTNITVYIFMLSRNFIQCLNNISKCTCICISKPLNCLVYIILSLVYGNVTFKHIRHVVFNILLTCMYLSAYWFEYILKVPLAL